MHIGFDLTSGEILHELTLPDNTILLIAPGLMLAPSRGELRCGLLDDTISHGELTLMVAPEDMQRMADAGVVGIPESGEWVEHLLVEVTFSLNTERFGEYAAQFSRVDEPMDLLFLRDDVFPVLLNLKYYDVSRIVQETASVESEVELSQEE